MSRRIITVFGVTGLQGNAVARALLQSGLWNVRGVTRHLQSDKAESLRAQKVEIVEASLDDKESLRVALSGSYGVFLVTNYWEYMDQEREMKQGIDAADVSRNLGVAHLVYSGQEHAKKVFGEAVPHMDGKGQVEEYILSSAVPSTIVRYPSYYENLLSGMTFLKQSDGSYGIALPMGKHPLYGLSVRDGGPAVAAIFGQPDEYIGKTVGLARDHLTISQYAEILTKCTSKTFRHMDVSHCSNFFFINGV